MTLVEMQGILKRFPPSTTALDKVNFKAEPGEIHCLLGENGAGKTTLMNILYGLYRQDEGKLLLNGSPVEIRKPKDAIDLRIGMVHQHFKLVQQHTVAENVALGLKCRNGMFPLPEARSLITDISARYGLMVDPSAYVWQLSAGEQQRVEIIKVLCRDVNVLILDEPTSILTPQEADSLFTALRQLASEGKAVIVITHKLDEVMAISDRVTVLRRGRHVDTVKTASTSKQALARMMVGREVLFRVEKEPITPGATVLEVQGLEAFSDSSIKALNGLTLKVREGEILGVAGVAGNGQRELVEVVTGLRGSSAGTVSIDGTPAAGLKPKAISSMGVAHIPEERIRRGTVPGMTVAENLMLRTYHKGRGFTLHRGEGRSAAAETVKAYRVDTPSIDTKVKLLSGGNIQKIILARELRGDPRLIVASHPTYGLDVGATEQIREALVTQRGKGAAVLLLSEDLEELMALSDRIVVMYRGRIVGEVDPSTAEMERIGLLMAGGTPS